MIYEKREKGANCARIDIPEIRGDMRRIAVQGKEGSISVAAQAASAAPGKGYTVRKRRVSRLALAACLVLCVLFLDKAVLGGNLSAFVGECALKGARYALEGMDTPRDNNITLYTRLVTDTQEKAVSEQQSTESPVADAGVGEETVTASGDIATPGFADGVKYLPISYLDLSAENVFALSNETSFSPDVGYLSSQKAPALENIRDDGGPLVLIVHTHGEECYTEHTDMYPEGEATRSTDTQKNVVRVGEEIAGTLRDFGIETIHCTKLHDSESFINAYSSSAASVREYLEANPSIRVVVDVHRDAIIRDDGESVAAVTEIAGEEYAQLMFVVGTNELGHNHPDWQDNLSLALDLQESLDNTYPTLCRSINLRNVPFNQQLSSGYLLLEVGTSANTLEQALRSARAFGENLARAVMMS